MDEGRSGLRQHLNIGVINPHPVGDGGAGGEAAQILQVLHGADAVALLGQAVLGTGFEQVGVVAELVAIADLSATLQ